MITKKLEDLKAGANPHGVDARNLYDTEAAVITAITLKPGQSLKRHVTPVDVAFYVLEGRGDVEIGEERTEVGKDTLVESPKGIMHCLYNTGHEDFRVLVVKAPRPSAKTVFPKG